MSLQVLCCVASCCEGQAYLCGPAFVEVALDSPGMIQGCSTPGMAILAHVRPDWLMLYHSSQQLMPFPMAHLVSHICGTCLMGIGVVMTWLPLSVCNN